MTQLDEQNDKKISDADVIVATAAKTLFWLVVWVALFFTLFRFVFPVAAMNLYDDMGNVPTTARKPLWRRRKATIK